MADKPVDLAALVVVALDAEGNVLACAPVGKDGQFKLPVESLAAAARLVIAPLPDPNEPPSLDESVPISVRDFVSRLKPADNVFELDQSRWTFRDH